MLQNAGRVSREEGMQRKGISIRVDGMRLSGRLVAISHKRARDEIGRAHYFDCCGEDRNYRCYNLRHTCCFDNLRCSRQHVYLKASLYTLLSQHDFVSKYSKRTKGRTIPVHD